MTQTRTTQLMRLYRLAQERVEEDPRWTGILRTIRIRLGWVTRGNPYSSPAKERWAETMWR